MPPKKDLTNQIFGRLIALHPTEKRKQGCIVWECQCECGKILEVPSRSLTSGNTKSCGCLNQDLRVARIQKYNADNFKDLSGEKRGRLTILEPTEKRSSTGRIIWKCLCDCGNITFVSSDNLQGDKFTQSCGCLKHDSAPYRDLLGQRFGKLLVIEKTDIRKDNHIVWKCLCDCGNVAYVSSQSLVSNSTKSCGCLKSQGEEKIGLLLKAKQISFEKEKIFDSCLLPSGYHPRFDFYVNNQYLLEYDGIQHFEQTGWESLEIIQNRDAYKNQWCKDNNIPLIRIPYTKLNTLCIEDLLLETSKFII